MSFRSSWVSARVAQDMRQRVSQLARRLDVLAHSGSSDEVEIVYDNRWCPPAYGDYFLILMLVRFLTLNGLNVRFKVPQHGDYRRDWAILHAIDIDRFTNEQRLLASRYLPSGIAVFPEQIKDASSHRVSAALQLFDFEQITSGYPYYRLAGGVIVTLITRHSWEIPDGFLLTSQGNSAIPGTTISRPHISWSIRDSKWEKSRNSTEAQTLLDLTALRCQFPDVPIHVLGDPRGLEMIGRTFAREGIEWSEELVRQPREGFSGAMDSAVSSSFYFQRLGGGLHMVPLFTANPFLMIHPHRGDFHFGHGRKILPWSSQDQQWVASRRDATVLPIEACLPAERCK